MRGASSTGWLVRGRLEVTVEGMEILNTTPPKNILEILTENRSSEFTEIVLNTYKKAHSFNFAELFGQNVILPYATYFTSEQILQVLNTYTTNAQIFQANESPSIMEQFYELTKDKISDPRLRKGWEDWVEYVTVKDRFSEDYLSKSFRQKLITDGFRLSNP